MFQHVESRDIENISEEDSEDGDSDENLNLHDIDLEKIKPVLEKHKEAAHENVELFCHYFNNEKDCPFDNNCMKNLGLVSMERIVKKICVCSSM